MCGSWGQARKVLAGGTPEWMVPGGRQDRLLSSFCRCRNRGSVRRGKLHRGPRSFIPKKDELLRGPARAPSASSQRPSCQVGRVRLQGRKQGAASSPPPGPAAASHLTGPPPLLLLWPQCLHLYEGGGHSTLPGGVAGGTEGAGAAGRARHPQTVSSGCCLLRAHQRPERGETRPRPRPRPREPTLLVAGALVLPVAASPRKKQSLRQACGAHVFVRYPLGEVLGPVQSG